MNAKQHRAIAEWHNKQADLHETNEEYSCGCPVSHHETKSNVEILEEMKVEYH